MKSKKAFKLKIGMFVEVLWHDSKPEVAMVVAKPTTLASGVPEILLFYPFRKNGNISSWAKPEQLTRLKHESLSLLSNWPEPVSDSKTRFPDTGLTHNQRWGAKCEK